MTITSLILLSLIAVLQVSLYRISPREGMLLSWRFLLFYFLLFLLCQGNRWLASVYELGFYEIGLFYLLLFFGALIGERTLPRVQTAFKSVPDFYLCSALCIGIVWSLSSADQTVLAYERALGFFLESLSCALFLAAFPAILASIRERLRLQSPQQMLMADLRFLLSTGFFVVGLICFLT